VADTWDGKIGLMDKEVLLHIIDGPGTGLTLMVLGFFILIGVLVVVRWSIGYEAAINEGRAVERRDGLDQIRAQMAKVIFDQQQMMNRLPERSNAVDEQVG
jgi:hypothetical protein